MKKKNFAALVLALCLFVPMFSACGDSGSNPGSPSPSSSAPQDSNTPQDSTAPAESSTPAGGVTTVTPGKLTVATSPDFAPMEFVDATKSGQDQYVGFDVTLAKYIAEQMGLELVISPMSFDACQVAVSMGQVDMAISGFSWTADREKNYNMSDTYHAGDNEDGQTLICMASAGDKYKDAPNVEGLKAGYQGASLQQIMVEEQLPNAEGVPFGDISTGVMQLRNGDFDVMAVADGNATALIAANPDVALTGFDFVVDEKYTDNLVLMQKGNDDLTAKVNEILAGAKAAGLYEGWYDDAKALAGIEVAYDQYGNPVEYDENGNPIEKDADGNPIES